MTSLTPEGLRAQIAQQQQQLMAMVQTQSLLAAVQAQAQSQANPRPQFNPAGLLPTPQVPPDRRNQQQQQMRKRRNDTPMQGGNYGKRERQSFDNRNRNQQNYQNRRGGGQWGQKQNRRAPNSQQQQQQQQQRRGQSPPPRSFAEKKEEEEKKREKAANEKPEETLKEPDVKEVHEELVDEKETSEKTQEAETASVQADSEQREADKPPNVINFLGQDVEELMTSLYNSAKKKYVCKDCKIICIKETSFRQHLVGKRHSKTILENQGKELNLDEWKKFQEEKQGNVPERVEKPAPVEEKQSESGVETDTTSQSMPPPSPPPSQSDEECDFVKYTCDTRKTAVKNEDLITISSITEARVRISGFTTGRNMFGCEFVKAVAGFNCRLCKSFIRYGNDVTSHIRGKKTPKKLSAVCPGTSQLCGKPTDQK